MPLKKQQEGGQAEDEGPLLDLDVDDIGAEMGLGWSCLEALTTLSIEVNCLLFP